jgi:hypothetical protein
VTLPLWVGRTARLGTLSASEPFTDRASTGLQTGGVSTSVEGEAGKGPACSGPAALAERGSTHRAAEWDRSGLANPLSRDLRRITGSGSG